MNLTAKDIDRLKESIENVRQDLLRASEFLANQNKKNTGCKINSALFNNTKTLNILNKIEGK